LPTIGVVAMTIEEALGVLDLVLQESLNNTQELVFRYAWEGRTYEEIAEILGYVTDYIRSVGAQLWGVLSDAFGEKVTKNNLQTVLRRWVQQRPELKPVEPKPLNSYQDWGDAPDVFGFVGRSDELAMLEQWITHDRCRLVSLFGMGGMGKTSLAVVLAKRLQDQFDYVVWRSFRNAPSIQSVLSDLLEFFAAQQGPRVIPNDLNQSFLCLIEYLRQYRCLIVLDNFETVLPGDALTNFKACVLEHFLDLPHQSCILVTSREKSDTIAWKEGATLPIRSLHLRGLNATEGQAIFAPKGTFSASESDWQTLVHYYAGNPLALKMVAAAIGELFSSNITEFLQILKQNTLVFDDIRSLLDHQFNRLSTYEKEVMYWLAIHREVLSFSELQQDLLLPDAKRKLPETLKALRHRFLIEKSPDGFTQQPVIMEYLTEKIVEQACQEIVTEESEFLTSHALMKAQTKDYLRESQKRLILESIIERLSTTLRSQEIEQHCDRILQKLQAQYPNSTGYAAGNLINLLCCLKIDLTGRDFSYLTISQAYLQDVSLNGVNFAHSNLARSVFVETLGNIWSVAFSPDGTLLAASDTGGEIHFWQVNDGKKILTCKGHSHWVCTIAFIDNQTLVSGSADHTLKLWDVATGECLQTFHGHEDWVISVAFFPQHRLVASSGVDRTIKLWNIDTGQCLQTLQEHRHWVCTIAFSPNGQWLVSGSDDHCLKLWDIKTGQCLRTYQGHTSHVRAVAIAPSSEMIASGGDDGTIKLWDISTGDCITTLKGHLNPVRSLVFNPDGRTLASASEDHTLKLWDMAEHGCLKTLQGHTAHVRTLAFSPDGQTLASGSADQTVKLWHGHTGQCLKTLQGYTNFVLSIAFSSDGQTLASGSADHTVKLWQLPPSQEKQGSNTAEPSSLLDRPSIPEKSNPHSSPRILKGHSDWVLSVAFSPDGETVASGSFDQTIRLWHRASGECLKVLRGHKNWIHSVAFSPDGQLLASGSSDQTIQLWDGQTGDRLATFRGHTSHVWSVAFSPDGQFLASGGDACVVKLWNLAGDCLYTLQGHTHRVYSIAFSPDGRTLVSSSVDQTVKLWDVSQLALGEAPQEIGIINIGSGTGAGIGRSQKVELEGIGWVKSIAFSPDGQTLASSNTQPVVKLWQVATGCCMQVMRGHSSRIWSIVFSPNGQILASGSEDGTIRLWHRETGECLGIFRNPRPYEEMNITNVMGITEAQRRMFKALGAIVPDTDLPAKSDANC
jgi:WD40 repeat protein